MMNISPPAPENLSPRCPDLAIFLATSGHSGVDRVMKNLIGEITGRGLKIDLLCIDRHGPYLDPVPENLRLVDLGTAHVNSSLPALIRYLRRVVPPVLLTDKDRVNRLALWGRRLAGVPTRVAVRVGSTVSESLAMRRWLNRHLEVFSYRHFYSWADTVIVPSQGAAQDFARVSGLPPEHIQAIPSPVVSDRLNQLAEAPVDHPWFHDQGPPVILGVGELCLRKDFAILIEAFSLVRRDRPVRLLILGEGRQRKELVAKSRALGVQDDVSLPGFSENPYAHMRRAALFVLTSRNEGSPVVLMEALAVGVPVISTDCPSGPREILQDGRFGPLVPVGDAEALARAIHKTLDAPLSPSFLHEAARPFSVSESSQRYLAAMGIDLPVPGPAS